MLRTLVGLFLKIARWLHPWETQIDESRQEELYRRFIDSLG